MNILRYIYNTVIDALFPLSETERVLIRYAPIDAYTALPQAPGYQGLAIPLVNAHSIFAYKDPIVTQLIWQIKYKKSSHAIAIGGYALLQQLHKVFKTEHLYIIPLPITERRRRERGYNQCELLADELKSLDTQKQFTIISNLLIRTHHDSRHTLKNRQERLASAHDVFGLNEKVLNELLVNTHNFKNSPVVIIDDVITTGSTMSEAVNVLTSSGFSSVHCISLAH